MSMARFHEGTAPASDTCVRLDAPWGRRVGNDIKFPHHYQTAAMISSDNRRIKTVKNAFPISVGEIADKKPLDYIAYKAGRQALQCIPCRFGFEDDPEKMEPWKDVSWELGKAYTALHRKFLQEKRPQCSPEELVRLNKRLEVLTNASNVISPHIVGGVKMITQWLILAGLSSFGDESYIRSVTDNFFIPSIEPVRHNSYTGIAEFHR